MKTAVFFASMCLALSGLSAHTLVNIDLGDGTVSSWTVHRGHLYEGSLALDDDGEGNPIELGDAIDVGSYVFIDGVYSTFQPLESDLDYFAATAEPVEESSSIGAFSPLKTRMPFTFIMLFPIEPKTPRLSS